MKLIKVLVTSLIAGVSLSITSVAHAACTGTASVGASNGCFEATHPAYVILGTVTDLDDVATTILYNTQSGGGLDSATETSNNVGSSNNFMDGDNTAISFVDNGTIGIRANAPFTLTLTVPVISTGSACVPAFKAQTQTGIGVTADFRLSVVDDSSTEVASYAVSDAGTASGSVASLACPAAGVSNGTFTIALSPTVTTEYTLAFDIGFEIDGAKDTSLTAVGADGEPAADTYEMTLGLSASAT